MLEVFDYQGQQVRTDYKDEAVWFVAADVCGAIYKIGRKILIRRSIFEEYLHEQRKF